MSTISKTERLRQTIAAVCPIVGLSVPTVGLSAGVRIDFDVTATGPQQTAGNSALASFDWSDAAQTAWQNLQDRIGAKSTYLTDVDPQAKVVRAIAAVLVDEVNVARQWIMSFKSATAAATSLANLQTRVAALADMPDRTLIQARTAVQSKIDSGAVD